MTESEIAMLATDGWFSREDSAAAAQIAQSAKTRVTSKGLSPSGFSRAQTKNAAVRGDVSQWLNAHDADFAPMWTFFEALRLELNQAVWLGLMRFDVQLAHYAGGGASYARHLDAFAGAESRRVTAILYLNPAWKWSDGGQLRLHTPSPVDIAPMLGRLVVFRSAQLEHEVLGSFAPRLAVTAWYYG
jgi:SM-20-related protein